MRRILRRKGDWSARRVAIDLVAHGPYADWASVALRPCMQEYPQFLKRLQKYLDVRIMSDSEEDEDDEIKKSDGFAYIAELRRFTRQENQEKLLVQ